MKSKALLITAGVLLGGGALAWFFFGGTSKHQKLIPLDAQIVMTFDFKSIYKKMDSDKVKEMAWYRDLVVGKEGKEKKGAEKVMSTIMAEKAGSGFDVFSDVYFFTHDLNGQQYAAMVFAVSDETALQKTLSDAKSDLAIIHKDRYQLTKMDGLDIAWNDDMGMIFDAPGYSFYDEGEGEEKDWKVQFLDWSFGRDNETSILESSEFSKYGKGKGEISLFLNGTVLYDLAIKESRGMEVSMMKNMSYMRDSYFMADLNFADDAIVISTSVKSNNPEYEKVQFLKTEGLSADHLKLITNKDVYGLMSLNINVASIYDFYRDIPGFSDLRDEMVRELGISEEQMKNALGGEMSAALVGFEMITTDPFADMSPEDIELYKQFGMYDQLLQEAEPQLTPIFTFNLSFNDKDVMRNLLNKSLEKGMMTVSSEGIYSFSPERNLHLNIAETSIGMIVTNSKDIAQKAKAGAVSDLPSEIASLPKDNAMSLYFNTQINDYPEDVQTAMTRGFFGRTLVPYLSMFDYTTATGNKDKAELRYNLVEGEGNSLYRIMLEVEKAYVSSNREN